MMMPTQPRANFIMIHAQAILAFLDRRFHRPSQPCPADQFVDGRFSWCIAEIDFELCLITQRATKDNPHIWSRQLVPYRNPSPEGKLGNYGAFAAFLDHIRMPIFRFQIHSDLVDTFRFRFAGNQLLLAWSWASARPLWYRCLWSCLPQARIVWHFGQVQAVQVCYTVKRQLDFPISDN
jgi:hypothetical protein